MLHSFCRRQIYQTEINQSNKYNAIDDEDAMLYIIDYPSSVEGDVELCWVMQVKCLIKDGVFYSVFLNASTLMK